MQPHQSHSSFKTLLTMNRPAARSPHTVQFYESDVVLAQVVGDFIGNALGNAEPAVVVATAEHRIQLLIHLQAKGFKYEKLLSDGLLVFLDARTLMSEFMVDGMPDAAKFRSTLVPLLREVTTGRGNKQVRIYGEMVDLLCEDGNSEGAIALEALWNELADRLDFSLLCGYHMSHLGSPCDESVYRAICSAHSHVFALAS